MPPHEILGAYAGCRSFFMDDQRISFQIPGFDDRFRCKGVSGRNDDLVAVLQDLAHEELLVGHRIGYEAEIVGERCGFLDDQIRRQEFHGDPDLRIRLDESVDDERKIVGAEALAGEDSEEASFPLLKITEAFLRLILHLEDGLGDTVKDLSRIGQGHPLSEAIEEFDLVMLLKTLDALRDGGLGDIQSPRGGAEASVFCGHVEDLQLIEIHNL